MFCCDKVEYDCPILDKLKYVSVLGFLFPCDHWRNYWLHQPDGGGTNAYGNEGGGPPAIFKRTQNMGVNFVQNDIASSHAADDGGPGFDWDNYLAPSGNYNLQVEFIQDSDQCTAYYDHLKSNLSPDAVSRKIASDSNNLCVVGHDGVPCDKGGDCGNRCGTARTVLALNCRNRVRQYFCLASMDQGYPNLINRNAQKQTFEAYYSNVNKDLYALGEGQLMQIYDFTGWNQPVGLGIPQKSQTDFIFDGDDMTMSIQVMSFEYVPPVVNAQQAVDRSNILGVTVFNR